MQSQVHRFQFLVAIFLFNTPSDVVLSVWVGVSGCGHPISIKVCLMGTSFCTVIYTAANPASASEVMTNLITWAMDRIDPFHRGIGSYSDRKI